MTVNFLFRFFKPASVLYANTKPSQRSNCKGQAFRLHPTRTYTFPCHRHEVEHSRNSSNAGFFLWIDLSKCLEGEGWQAETALKKKLVDAGIEMSTGQAYHDETPGRFRFIFSVDKDLMLEGLKR